MFVWHDVFNTLYFPFVPAFKVHPPSFKLGVWIKSLLFELLLVLRTSKEQPCLWLCILYLLYYSGIKQVSTYFE